MVRIVVLATAWACAVLASGAQAGTFEVNTAGNVTPSDCEKADPNIDECTLRDAVQDANADPDASTINFKMTASEPGQPAAVDYGSAVISLIHQTRIDGFTQSAAGLPPGTPPIDLGATTISLFSGGTSPPDNSVIRGLIVAGIPGTINTYGGIVILSASRGAVVEGNWIGIDRFGLPTGGPTSISCGGCTDAVIGGIDSEDRNVLSGNSGPGVLLQNAASVSILRNYIGLDPDGSTRVRNGGAGISVTDSANIAVGSALPNTGNVISGSGPEEPSPVADSASASGVSIRDSAAVTLQRNRIGTNAAGTAAIPNTGHGVLVRDSGAGQVAFNTTNIRIGTPGAGNLISGNGSVTPQTGDGVLVDRPGPDRSTEKWVQGNLIGTKADGTGSIPNRRNGVYVDMARSRVLVGGTEPGAGNVIANSATRNGVNVLGSFNQTVLQDQTAILGNRIFNNAGLGISLADRTTPLANDDTTPPYDRDFGPNEQQNYPRLSAAGSDGAQTTVAGELRTTPGIYRIEVFSSPSCDPTGNGEGHAFLGGFEVIPDADGIARFSESVPVPVPAGDQAVTATATNTQGGFGKTSEFSPCIAPTSGYPTPESATPLRVPLVPAFKRCTASNRTHGPPLAHPSCNPPELESAQLAVGTPDANGRPSNATGFARYAVRMGVPGGADDADVAFTFQLTDVRHQSTLADYAGELQAKTVARITDRHGSATDEAATVTDISFLVTVPCTPTGGTANVGSTCAVTTSFDAVVPGAIPEAKRAIWELDQVKVTDGGPDGDVDTDPNTLFAVQGVFVP